MKRRNKALSILLTLAMLLWLIPVRSARASLSKDGAVLAESGLLCVGGVNIAEAANNTVEDELGGKAVLRYDDEGNPVLTLTGYTYEGQGYFAEEDPRTVAGAIYYSGTAPLTVYLSGTSNVTQVTRKVSAPQTACGVYSASAPLIFAGNGTLTAKGGNTADIVTFNGDELQEEFGMSLGVNAKAVTVEKGAAIYAAGSMASKYSCGVKCGSLTLSDASTRLTALGCETEDGSCSCGVNCDSLTVGDGATLIASGEGRAIFGTVKNAVTGSGYSKADSLGGWETIDFNNTDEGQQLTYKCVKFPVHYDLWLGGTQVNAYNRTGVPAAVGTSSGTASYDAETNTLTLNQYTYSGEACVTFSETDEYNAALIWFGTDELTIALTGTNSVTEQESNDETVVSFGVYSGSAGLRFTGDGSLEIADGLLCKNGNVIVENGAALSVTGNEIGSTSHGVRCETGSVTVSGKGSSLTAVGGSSRYISCGVRCDTGSVTVEDGASLTATGKAAASISCGVWCVNKGGVTVGNSATLIADGKSCGVNCNGGCVTVNDGAVLAASGSSYYAISGSVKNALAGVGLDSDGAWKNIDVSEDGQTLSQKKVSFPKLTVTFDANGGEGSMAAQTVPCIFAAALPAGTFTREGYAFTGWNTEANGSGTAFDDEAAISLTKDTTLYAQWEKQAPSVTITGVSGGTVSFTVKYAPENPILIAARYENGILTAVTTTEDFTVGTVTPGGSGENFKLMLVDKTSFAPLCAAAEWPLKG